MAQDPEWEVEDEGEVEKLESDVREMCKKISEHRHTTLPDHHLKNTALSSSSHTPNIDSGSGPLPSSKPLTTSAEAEMPLVLLGTEEQDCGQKLIQLKETVSNNTASITILAKRVQECVEGIHKLDDSLNRRRTIHPAFRKPRNTP